MDRARGDDAGIDEEVKRRRRDHCDKAGSDDEQAKRMLVAIGPYKLPSRTC